MQNRIENAMQYLFSAPEDFDERTERLPLLIYLHGAGGRGHDLHVVRVPYTAEKFCRDRGKRLLIAAPLCEYDSWYCCFSELIAWVRFIAAQPYVDPDRVFIMGSSMGGYAAWTMLMCTPELFAAGAVVCGGGMAWNCGRMKHIPIRAFHGELDTAVLPSENKRMVDAVNACGGHAEMILFPGVGHNAWNPALLETDLIDWLLAQTRYHE